ncbi:MAG: DUF1543 domain-containing protein [Ferruginibacter sp.]
MTLESLEMNKLFMVLVGCSPAGRHTEQHDVFFGIAKNIRDILPQVVAFWPEAKGKLHLDAWREVNHVDGYTVEVVENKSTADEAQLFFINLGGYKKNEFEEFHYKMLVAAVDKGQAIAQSKKTAFYRHTGFKGATSHIDDKYGVDVDDIYSIGDILPKYTKEQFSLQITKATQNFIEDEIHLGYFKLDNPDKWAPPYSHK